MILYMYLICNRYDLCRREGGMKGEGGTEI